MSRIPPRLSTTLAAAAASALVLALSPVTAAAAEPGDDSRPAVVAGLDVVADTPVEPGGEDEAPPPGGGGDGNGTGGDGNGTGGDGNGTGGDGNGTGGDGNGTGGDGTGTGTGNNGGAEETVTPPVDPGADDQADQQRLQDEQDEEQAEQERLQDEQREQQQALARQQREEQQARDRFNRAAANAERTWTNNDKPSRLIIIRDDSINLVTNGRLDDLIARSPGAISLGGIADLVPEQFLSVEGETARLAAAMILTPGVVLTNGGVKTLNLTGGPEPTDASWMRSGSGTLRFTGLQVSSVDKDSGEKMGAGNGRPFVVVSGGGTLEATDSTFQALGRAKDGEVGGSGVQVSPTGTAKLVNTTFTENTVGLELNGTVDSTLENVTVSNSELDGLMMRGDQGTTLAGVRAEGNGYNGVKISGKPTPDRVIENITTTGNALYGISCVGQTGIQIRNVTTDGDLGGGFQINRCSGGSLVDSVARNQPIGVFAHVGATEMLLQGLKIEGGRLGVLLERTITSIQLKGIEMVGTELGVEIGGKQVLLDGLTVRNAQAAVRVQRGSEDVQVLNQRLEGGTDGVVVGGGAKGAVVRNLTAEGVTRTALRTIAPDTVVEGAQIGGSTTGVDVGAAATLTDLRIDRVKTGIRARGGEEILADRINITALDLGLDVEAGTRVVLTNSVVDAVRAVQGQIVDSPTNQLSLPGLNVLGLGAIGVPLILLALVLEELHTLRQRRWRRSGKRLPPTGPPAPRTPSEPPVLTGAGR